MSGLGSRLISQFPSSGRVRHQVAGWSWVSQLVVAVSILVLEIIIFILTATANCIYGVDARSESEIR